MWRRWVSPGETVRGIYIDREYSFDNLPDKDRIFAWRKGRGFARISNERKWSPRSVDKGENNLGNFLGRVPLAVAQYGARDINHRTPSDLFRDQKQKRPNGLCFNRANNQRCCSPLVIGRERSRVLVCENARKLSGRTIIFSLTFFHFFFLFSSFFFFFFFNLSFYSNIARRVTSPYEKGKN